MLLLVLSSLAHAAVTPTAAPSALSAAAEPELEVIPPPPAAKPLTATAIGTPPYVTPVATAGGMSAPGYLQAFPHNREVLLHWYPSEGSSVVSGYLVFRGLSPTAISALPINKNPLAENDYSDNDDASLEGPKNRLTYYYRVRAYNAEGRLSPYSDIASAEPNGPLLPPTKLETSEGEGKIVLHWSPPLSSGEHDIVALQVFRTQKSGEAGELLKELPADASTYEDAGLSNGKPYYYTLRSKDSAGALSPPSPEQRAVAYKAVPAPQGLSALGVGDEAVRLKWAAPDETKGGTFRVKGYNVYRSTQAPVDLSSRPVNKALIPAGRTKWEDGPEDSVEAPKKGIDYHYVLLAVDEEDKPSAPSEESVAGPVASLTGFTGQEVEYRGNTLKIEGRKTINASSTWVFYKVPQATSTGTGGAGFALDQQLQVRLTGKVGRKIKVDVDYDDKAVGSQQQKISVVYTGDSQEVFKEFAFGDIVMDLNSSRTEFAGYNKSLFGAKLKLESPDSRLRLTAIGAQTKGFTETKRIVGGYEQVKTGTTLGKDVPDSAFLSRRYFYLSREKSIVEGQDYIEPGSENIYVDRPSITNNLTGMVQVPDPSGSGVFYFQHLDAGVSYTLDNATGLVNFQNFPIRPDDNIAVAYRVRRANGTTDSVGYAPGGGFDFSSSSMASNDTTGVTTNQAHLIQYGNRNKTSYDSHMSFQFYNLGNTNILNPQLDPDFRLVIYGPGQSIIYQLDPHSNFSDVVNIDPRSGLMAFRVPFPMAKTTTRADDLRMSPDFHQVEQPFQGDRGDVYNQGSTQSNFTIHIEYKSKLSSYSLRFNIIRGSEYITLDGRHLNRDLDYFLDYDTGFLTFSNPDLVKDNSVVEATYEYLPFGGQFTSTIWGTRGEYDITKNLSLGSTFIWNSSDATQEVPDVRSSPYSLQILDGDIQASFPQDALDSVTGLIPGVSSLPTPLKVNARAEAAHSWYRPNTYTKNNETGVAMIDSFEAVDNLVSTSVDENAWEPASSPVDPGTNAEWAMADRRFSKFVNIQDRAHDASQRSQNNENPNRTMIEWSYGNFSDPAKWDSFVYSFGGTPPTDVNKASTLAVWVKVVGGGAVDLRVDVGVVNEDADNNKQLDRESSTGYLGEGQDIGFYNQQSVHSYPLPEEAPGLYMDPNYWGRDNKVIDGEDLDANGSLNYSNRFYSFTKTISPVSDPANNDFQLVEFTLTKAGIVDDFGGVNALSLVPGNINFYANIQNVRISLRNAQFSDGKIQIESVQFKGNKWQLRADPNVVGYGSLSVTADNITNKFKVDAINRTTAQVVAGPNFDYQPNLNFFDKATSGSDDREQGLQIEYALTKMDETNGQPYYQARRELSSASVTTDFDFGNYQKMRVDIYKPLGTLPGERLLIRLVRDDLNYFEYPILMDDLQVGAWQTVTLALDGSDGKRTQFGQTYLRTVRYVALAIDTLNTDPPTQAATGNTGKERIWLNNLRLTDAITKEGGAERVGMTYDLLNGKIVLNEDIREVESDFVRIDQQASAPVRHQRTHILDSKINLVDGIPVTARYEDAQNFTEVNRRDDPLYSRNFVDPDESSNKSSVGVGFTKVPNLVVNGSASLEHTRQIFLPRYIDGQHLLAAAGDQTFSPNNNKDHLRLANDNTYTIPDNVWWLNKDQLKVEESYDESSNAFDVPSTNPLNLTYFDTRQQTRTGKYRYSGSYKWGSWLTVSPSYAYTLVEAEGNIPQPIVRAPYYQLDSERRVEDYVPQTRSINPSLQLQFASLGFVKAPRLNYTSTQTRDYVRNEVRSPTSLDLSTSIDLAAVGGEGGPKLPSIDFTQSFSTDSVINNEQRIRGDEHSNSLRAWLAAHPDFANRYPAISQTAALQDLPSVALSEQQDPLQGTWWVRIQDPLAGETRDQLNDPLNIENVAQSATKHSSSNFSTRFDLPFSKDWVGALTPHLNLIGERTMSAPEQTTMHNQLSYGSGLDFANPKVPFWATLKPSNLSLSYDRSETNFFVVTYLADQRTSNDSNNSISATLPTRPTDRNAITFKTTWSGGETINYSNVGNVEKEVGRTTKSSLNPSLTWVYLLSVDRPWKMPDMWPFYGRELRIKQNFRLDNLLEAKFDHLAQTASTQALPETVTDTYHLRNQIGYNVLDNVTLNFVLEQQLFQDKSTADAGAALANNKDFYSIKFELGLEARF